MEQTTPVSAANKYLFYKDLGFITAFLLSGGPILYALRPVAKGLISFDYIWTYGALPQLLIIFVVWPGWIFFSKGKKWSFVIGFLAALVLSFGIGSMATNMRKQKLYREMDNKFNSDLNRTIPRGY